MSKFYKEYLSWSDLKDDRKFLKISDCIELINESEFKDELIRLFNIEEIGDENRSSSWSFKSSQINYFKR